MVENEKILENLEKVGFGRKEAEVFLELIKNPGTNGSQIAKTLGYPRTTVYQNLDILQKKGYINSYLDKEITFYKTMDLNEIFENYKKNVESATKFLKDELNKVGVSGKQKQFYNLNSFDDIKDRFKTILKRAEKVVYINTNLDLFEFEKDFKKLKEKGVRIILFSFNKTDYANLGIEAYIRESFNLNVTDSEKRIMVAIDSTAAIIGSNYEGEFCGTYSENKLLVNIVTEHIKNDIHLMKLENQFGHNINKIITLDF
ncbi:MAG: TrmB family transcriptional regulator [Cetobacterium sp.]|uniref:TrmB family transcriptional regulator n=1 Tax=unclassified Cetobacterium TaxID=2630983 RepID=UPI000649067F|nr:MULTISPECIES: TrmB family transcriptional regulator [unclassified Cetobacterium]